MILRKDKNTLLTIIQESDLAPEIFATEDSTINKEKFFIIRLRNSPIYFAIRPFERSFGTFESVGSQFAEGFPLGGGAISVGIQELSDIFREWLNDVVKPYLDEVNTPDLWQNLEDMRSDVMRETGAPDYSESFSEEEKIQLRLSINEFRLLIKNNFNPNKEELAAINDRLEYLSDAIDKRNKFDWKGIAIHTVITIIVTLALNPEQSHQLFQLFKQVFSNIIYLLP